MHGEAGGGGGRGARYTCMLPKHFINNLSCSENMHISCCTIVKKSVIRSLLVHGELGGWGGGGGGGGVGGMLPKHFINNLSCSENMYISSCTIC